MPEKIVNPNQPIKLARPMMYTGSETPRVTLMLCTDTAVALPVS